MNTTQCKAWKQLMFSFVMLAFILVSTQCSKLSDVNTLESAEQEVELAIPLINTEFGIRNLTGDNTDSNVSVVVDDQDRVTLVYNGDVVRQDLTAVFPPVPILPTPLLDTVYEVPVPFASDQRVDRAIFGKTNMIFSFESQFEEDITVEVLIPQLSKDGESYRQEFFINYEGVAPVTFFSDSISIEGWTLVDDNKTIEIEYIVITSDGERQKLNLAAILFLNITFDYIEGYFGSEIFDINGDFVAIGVLDTWRSGGLAFEDPKVKVFVENSFGFPVRSIFNKMQVVTTTGEMLDMESEVIDNNVDFAYPNLDEQGEVKITEFAFTKDNSNIVDLFKEKVRRVTYDIDAGANPDMDETITGFVNEDSYFLVSVDVELPLNGSVNNLVLQDTLDLDLSDLDLEDANSAEFKNVIANGFPADITLQSYFYTEEGVLVDSLFESRLELPGASVNQGTGIANLAEERISYENFDATRLENIKKTKKMLVNVKINTNQVSGEPLWIYNDYGIKFRVGAKVKTTL